MPTLTYLIFALFLVSTPLVSFSGENTRVRITLEEVPPEQDIESQIFISWAPDEHNPNKLVSPRRDFKTKGGRNERKIVHVTKTEKTNPETKSFIVYGRIVTQDAKESVRFIPAKYFTIPNNFDRTQLEITIITRPTYHEAFLDSYPLHFNTDRNFLNSDNVRPALRSFRHMIEYRGETRSKISIDLWERIMNFFLVNRRFFSMGSSAELSDVLSYLKAYASARDEAPEVAHFYTQLLNSLIDLAAGKIVFQDLSLTDYLHSQLVQIYENRLNATISQADISLQKFNKIGQYEHCLTLAEKILGGLDQDYLVHFNSVSPNNLRSILIETTICGQKYFHENTGKTTRNVQDGSRFLKNSRIAEPTVREFLRICKILEDNRIITFRSRGPEKEIGKFCLEYYDAQIG